MCDEILIDALRMRCQIIQEITNYKQKNGLPIYQAEEEERKKSKMLAKLDDYEYKKSIMAVYDSVLYRSKRIQSHELFGFNIFLIGFMGVGKSTVSNALQNTFAMDVVEMDAASNNGVDDIRDLRDETAYTPSACKYKVYIIDEVHMLSTAAFNALLKTLEEPPAHVIFILATTEIQKVPATILSRCQRYDFTRIGPEDIARRVEYIAGEEKLELTPDGAELIARLADGALRDALSILDTCAGVTAKIDADVVRRMAGVTDRSYLFRISDALEAQDGAAALAAVGGRQAPDRGADRPLSCSDAGGTARRTGPAVRRFAGGRSPLSGKRPSAGTAGGHPCDPCAGQCTGAHDPRQRPAY